MNKTIVLNEKMIKTIKKYVWKREKNECWPWTGGKVEGYGQFMNWIDYNNHDLYLAHRVIYVITYGPFDWELQVCHNCDNPSCCNPNHLFLGTAQDNGIDCVNKGRNNNLYGEKHGMSKITEDDVRKIRFKFALGISKKDIGKEFNIHPTNVRSIVTYKTWKHVK